MLCTVVSWVVCIERNARSIEEGGGFVLGKSVFLDFWVSVSTEFRDTLLFIVYADLKVICGIFFAVMLVLLVNLSLVGYDNSSSWWTMRPLFGKDVFI